MTEALPTDLPASTEAAQVHTALEALAKKRAKGRRLARELRTNRAESIEVIDQGSLAAARLLITGTLDKRNGNTAHDADQHDWVVDLPVQVLFGRHEDGQGFDPGLADLFPCTSIDAVVLDDAGDPTGERVRALLIGAVDGGVDAKPLGENARPYPL